MDRKPVDFLFLSEDDMIKAGVLDTEKCLSTMEETFRLLGEGDYVMGGPNGSSHGSLLWFPATSPFPNMPKAGPDRRYMAMPAYLGGRFNICGVKWYGSNIANVTRGLPRSILLVCLNDADTGEPRAIMSANLLSAMRTGCVPGVATKYLARREAGVLGIVGCGVMNRACTKAILSGMSNKKKVILYDIKKENAEKLASEIEAEFGLEVEVSGRLDETIANADVVSIAASGTIPVRVEKSWLKRGSLFTVTGHVEVDDDFYTDNRLVFDHWKMHKAWLEEGLMHEQGITSLSGWVPTYQILKLYHDRILSDSMMTSLGEIISGKAQGRKDEDEIIVFSAGGLPVEDVSWGYTVYEKAASMGLGKKLSLWNKAYWA